MESVKQMQHWASSHCSLLRHTQFFMMFCCQCVLAIGIFFPILNLPPALPFCKKKKALSLLSSEASGPLGHRQRLNMWLSWGPAGHQSAASLCYSTSDNLLEVTRRLPPVSADKTEAGLKKKKPPKYVVNCSVWGEAAVKSSAGSECWNFVGRLRYYFFFCICGCKQKKKKNGGRGVRGNGSWALRE